MTASPPAVDPARAMFAPFLDGTRLGTLLRDPVAALWGTPVRIAACEVAHAWRRTYAKPEAWRRSHLRVCYRLALASPNGDTTFTAFVHGVVHLTEASDDDEDATVVRVGAATLRLRRFPEDEALPSLAELVVPERAAVRIAHLFGRTPVTAPVIDVLRYRPGERCVLRIDDGEPRFVKVYAHDAGARVWAHLRALHAQRVPVAEPLAWDAETHSVWARWVPDAAHARLAEKEGAPAVLASIGHALGRLHAAKLPDLAAPGREALLHDTRKRAVKLAHLFPALAGDLSVTLDRLTTQLRVLPARPSVPVHGDMHLDQCLFAGDRVLLADLDELALGDAEQDLAALSVDLRLRAASPATGDAWTEVVASACSRASDRAFDARVLAWHTARHAIDKAYRWAWRELPVSDTPIARLVAWSCNAAGAPHAVAA